MDATETLVANYLENRGFCDIVYEPDGNVPPDFVVDGRIAVEVRRLNQNFQSEGRTRGLEEERIPLFQRIEKLAHSIGTRTPPRSWFLNFSFRRPLEPWESLHPKIKSALETFSANPDILEPPSYDLGNGFELEFRPASKLHKTLLVMGAHIDDDSGGWVIGELQKSIDICIKQKTHKRKNARREYPEWWLAFANHVSYDIGADDLIQLRDLIVVPREWHKIILINPMDHMRAVEF